MSSAIAAPVVSSAPASWAEANRASLDLRLRGLRLRLHRRILWLRKQWGRDPLQGYHGLVISDAEADGLLASAADDRAAEARFRLHDPETKALSTCLDDVQLEIDGLAASMLEAPPALELLARHFQLTAFEQDVLCLCLAPEIDPAFERLYAYVQDDATRKHATPHLALALFDDQAGDPRGARDSFLPDAPLRRYRLLTLEPSPLPAATPGMRPLRLDERIGDYLLGVNRLDERLSQLLRPLGVSWLTERGEEIAARLAAQAAGRIGRGGWPVLNLIGPDRGLASVAAAACAALGHHLWALEPAALPPPGAERAELLRLLERDAALSHLAIYLDATRIGGEVDQPLAGALGDVVERVGALVVVGSREPWRAERELLHAFVPRPDAAAQRMVWRQTLTQAIGSGGAVGLDGAVGTIVQQFDLTPSAIRRAVATACDRAALRAPVDPVPSPDELWQACRELAGQRLDDLARRIEPCYAWDDLVLPDDVLRQLREIADQVAGRVRVYEEWGFGRSMNRGRGISALFAGPSGTGKTMAAEVLARELRLDLYRIDLAGVVSKYIGETEKNLRRVFDAAEQAGAVLFFDEADALFGKRSEVKDSHDRYANIEVNYLLQRMEDYRGLAILATNRKSFLDQAFLRRLRFLVDFPFPDAEDRLRMWQRVFPPSAALDRLDYRALARLEVPGGNIRNIAVNAAFLAASADEPIRMAHVRAAARREYAKIDKLATDAELDLSWRVAP
jgi:hypothetical protein